MPPLAILPNFNVLGDRLPRLFMHMPGAPLDQLPLERGEGALGHRNVRAVAHPARAGAVSRRFQDRVVGVSGTFHLPVRVMDEPRLGPSVPECHLEQIGGELHLQVAPDRPAYDSPDSQVEQHGQIGPASPNERELELAKVRLDQRLLHRDSCAMYAAAFVRKSRSCLTSSSLHWRRRISSSWLLSCPFSGKTSAGASPERLSTCRFQARSMSPRMPRSRAISETLRPFLLRGARPRA